MKLIGVLGWDINLTHWIQVIHILPLKIDTNTKEPEQILLIFAIILLEYFIK